MTVVQDIIFILEAKLNGPNEPWTPIGWADTEAKANHEKRDREMAFSSTSYRVMPLVQILPPR